MDPADRPARADADPLAQAARAVDARDLDGLRELLERDPGLVAAAVGANANGLLSNAVATRDERLVRLLLERGADPAQANVHGWTPLHQAAYVGSVALVELLLDAGAPLDVAARGDGGTPLVIALFWGHAEAAERLAREDRAPGNLRVAAGLGRSDLIERLVDADGRLVPAAGAHRDFHRPHSGFPAWRPSDDPQEARDEALAWAARSGRADALDLLVARGARVDADVYRGTALGWAAACGRADAVRRLLALGADPNGRTSFGGPDHGENATALHLAAQHNDVATIRALLDGGADPAIRDGRHGVTPADWADHDGRHAAAELLRGA